MKRTGSDLRLREGRSEHEPDRTGKCAQAGSSSHQALPRALMEFNSLNSQPKRYWVIHSAAMEHGLMEKDTTQATEQGVSRHCSPHERTDSLAAELSSVMVASDFLCDEVLGMRMV